MRTRTQALIAFFSAMAVTLVAVSDLGRTSPGLLASVHQREPELDGRNDCSSCHGGLFGTMRAACLECHEPIAHELADKSGLHGTLGARAEQCGLCHAEHHGPGAPLVHGQSFALAGVSKVAEFDHHLIGFAMDGAHLALACTRCHENASVALLAKGTTRYLGLDQDCASCHEDAHEGRFALACAQCHGQAQWDGLASLGHEKVLPLVGGHGGLACARCHEDDSAHALDVVGGRASRPRARTCVDCHDSPHSAPFANGVAQQVALPVGASCITCHAPEHTSFHDKGLLAMTKAQHAAAGFALDAPHDDVACTGCHSPRKNRFAARYPGRSAQQCSVCHADVHEGQFDTGAFAGQECTACHEATRWMPPTFGVAEHARTALALEGKHAEIGCEQCHARPDAQSARSFAATPSACDACHADAHAGFFADYVADLPVPAHGQCERCHDARSFADAERGFDHEAFTRFAVLGAHAESACTTCHERAHEPDASGRTFGRVEQRFGPFVGCVSCHADPHGGRFDAATGAPAEVDGQTDCARCHADTSFRTMPRGFEHGTWTGFALAGAHAAARCSACHEPLPRASELGRTSAQAAGAGCADCHEDPHAGQFADAQGVSDCARCHDAAQADFLVFDHERDARFALGDAHRSLACAACHKASAENGMLVTHFKPLGSACTDCHGSNAEVLLRRQPRK